MDVMDLMAKIGLDDSEYNKKLDGASGKFSSFGKTIASGAKTVGKVAVGAFATLGTAIGGATASLVSNAKETSEYADTVDKMSQKLGVSAEAYQEWDYVMNISGTSMQSMQMGMKTLTNKLDDAKNGSEDAAEMFAKLGLSMENIQGMSREEIFEAAINGFQGMEDSAERAALANDLFGKSGQELAPLFNTSAEETEKLRQEVKDLGGVMSDDAVKAGAAFKDSLTGLQTSLTGAKNNIMSNFLPSLTTMTDGLAKIFSGDTSGIELLKQGIDDFASKLNEKLPKILETVSKVAESLIDALPAFFDTIAQQLPSLLERLIPVLINAVVGLSDAIVKSLPKIMEAIQKNIKVISSGLTKIFSALGKIILQLLPTLLPTLLQIGIELIKELSRGFIENASEVIRVIFELIDMIVMELTNPDTLTQLLECGLQIILALAQGILDNLPQLLATLLEVFTNIVGWFVTEGGPMILNAAGKLFESIGEGLLKAWDFIVLKISELFGKILGEDGLGGWGADLLDNALGIFQKIGEGIVGAWDFITGKIDELAGWMWDGLTKAFTGMWDFGKELATNIWKGIKSMWSTLADALNPKNWLKGSGVADEAKEWATKFGQDTADDYVAGQVMGFDIHSPSKKMRWIGQMVMEGFSEGMEDESDTAFAEIENSFKALKPQLSVDVPTGSISNQTTDMNENLKNIYDALLALIKQGFNFTLPVFIGYEQIDEQNISSRNRVQVRSGGQVNA